MGYRGTYTIVVQYIVVQYTSVGVLYRGLCYISWYMYCTPHTWCGCDVYVYCGIYTIYHNRPYYYYYYY